MIAFCNEIVGLPHVFRFFGSHGDGSAAEMPNNDGDLRSIFEKGFPSYPELSLSMCREMSFILEW
jgi:hypothetical protein